MDWQELLYGALNSDTCVSVIAACASLVFAWLWNKKPKWHEWTEKYEGAALSAVKQAEKAIDDDEDNKHLKRLDYALKYIIRVAEAYEKRKVSESEKALLESIVNKAHDNVESPY